MPQDPQPISNHDEDFALFAPARGTIAKLALIRAGIIEFGESGLDGASTRSIAQRAGQNIASIAYYFGGKDGLYLAVADYMAETIMRRVRPLLAEVEAFLEQPRRSRAQCVDYLQRMLSQSYRGTEELSALSQVIVREQIRPTKAFDIFFAKALERPHRAGARLIAAYAGGDGDEPGFVIRYHMLLGSVLAFRVARETLLRRLGSEDLGDVDDALINQIIAEHVEAVMRAQLPVRKRATASPSRPGNKRSARM